MFFFSGKNSWDVQCSVTSAFLFFIDSSFASYFIIFIFIFNFHEFFLAYIQWSTGPVTFYCKNILPRFDTKFCDKLSAICNKLYITDFRCLSLMRLNWLRKLQVIYTSVASSEMKKIQSPFPLNRWEDFSNHFGFWW